jgi:hypothetical protein
VRKISGPKRDEIVEDGELCKLEAHISPDPSRKRTAWKWNVTYRRNVMNTWTYKI